MARPRVLPATDHRDEAGVDQHSPARRSGPTTNPSFLALLRVDLDALTRGRVESDETCDIAGVGAVPATVARRLLGDAVLKLVITRGTDVVNVTNLGRGPTAAQRIALLWNTPGCTNTACSNTLAIDHDHRTPWTEVRHTALANLDRLCRPCHDRKTHHRWALVAGNGPRPLVPPDDPRHPDHAPQPTRARQVRDPRRPDHPRDPDDPRRHAHARQTGDAGQAHEPRHPDDAPRPAPNAGPPGPPRSERDAPGQHAGSLFGADVA